MSLHAGCRQGQDAKNPAAPWGLAGPATREAGLRYSTVMTSANTTLGPVPAVPEPLRPPEVAT